MYEEVDLLLNYFNYYAVTSCNFSAKKLNKCILLSQPAPHGEGILNTVFSRSTGHLVAGCEEGWYAW